MRDRVEEKRITKELNRINNGTDPFAAAVRATRMPMVITDPNVADNPIVFANDAFCRLTGFERDEVVGRNCRFLQGPDTDRHEVDRLRQALADQAPIELELLNYRRDGTSFWNRLLMSPVYDDDGILTYYFASLIDLTHERERMATLERDRDNLKAEIDQRGNDLAYSEDRLKFALQAAGLGSWSLNLATDEMTVTDGSKINFGRPVSEPFTHDQLKAAVHPDDRARRMAALEQAINESGDYSVEYRIFTPDGRTRWIYVRGQVFHRADGTPLSILGVSQDITERKNSEEHRELLANELGHRVKNTLATLQAIVSQTLRNSVSLEAASGTLAARIQSMGVANDLLIKERWESAAITELIRRTLEPFAGEFTRIQIDGPEIQIPPRIAVALTLALHELATNAVRYGALSNFDGLVNLVWHLDTDTSPPELNLRWSETGGPEVVKPERTGFGSKLIQKVLASELGGSATVSYLPTGVVFDAVAPLPELEPAIKGDDVDNGGSGSDRLIKK